MENKKNKFLIIGIVMLVVVLITGVSYAIWQITLQQESTNVVNTACFKINFTGENEINLQNAYPINDEDGIKLTPYTFTIENICSTTATYQINLEELTTELKKLSNQYVKASLNNSKGKLLNSYEEVTTTLNEADTSHKLTTGVLKPDEIKEFNLRLWMNEDTPAIEDVMNATFLSKITIVAIQKEGIPEVEVVAEEYKDGITVDISTVENPKNETLTYFYGLNEEEEIESEESIHTFTGLSDGKYKARGRAETLDGIILEEKELDVTVAYETVYISSTGNDETGSGSIESPYASLQPAYNKVKSGGEMILLSDITATVTTNMNIENKEVTLRSEGEDVFSIFRGDSLNTWIVNISNSNTVTTTNVVFDGRNVNATTALLGGTSSTIYLNEGTIIKNGVNVSSTYTHQGGGINAEESIVNLNGSKIKNNKVLDSEYAQGGGIRISSSVLKINNGEITDNISLSESLYGGGGGIFAYNTQVTIYNGLIARNTGKYGGGINFDGEKDITMTIFGGTIQNNTASLGPNIYTTNGAQIIDERS